MTSARWTKSELLMLVLIVLFAVPLLFTLATAGKAATDEDGCRQRLAVIGAALRQYRDDWGIYPPNLRQLSPELIRDRAVFQCPAAPVASDSRVANGVLIQPFSRYSYMFQFANELRENPIPIQKGDPPNINVSWERASAIRGERLPIVMCQFHDPFLLKKVINGEVKPFVRLVVRVDGTVEKRVLYVQRQPGRVVRWYDY